MAAVDMVGNMGSNRRGGSVDMGSNLRGWKWRGLPELRDKRIQAHGVGRRADEKVRLIAFILTFWMGGAKDDLGLT